MKTVKAVMIDVTNREVKEVTITPELTTYYRNKARSIHQKQNSPFVDFSILPPRQQKLQYLHKFGQGELIATSRSR